MGCKESKQETGEGDPTWNGAKFRDPADSQGIGQAEEQAHLAAWKDGRTRLRIENNLHLRVNGSSALRATVTNNFLHIREEDDIAVDGGCPANRQPGLSDTAEQRCEAAHKDLHREGGPEGPIVLTTPSQPQSTDVKDRESESRTEAGIALSPLQEKKRRIEQEQERQRRQHMLSVDPSCWKALAAEQRYQHADDLLSEASKVEEEVNGRTERLALLSLSLAALFDERSNLDQTGQQQALSWAAVVHTRRGLELLASLGWAPIEAAAASPGRVEDDEEARRAKVLAGALLLGGRNLCHFALDGDGDSCTAVDAMAQAEAMLKTGIELCRRFEHAELAETVMMLGYLHYCRAGSLSNAFNCRSTRSVLSSSSDVEREYRCALDTYHEALRLFEAKGHPDGRDTIRPMCNIALAYKTLSLLDPSALPHALGWYQRALTLQESLFGKSDLSRRISADLDDVRKQLQGPASPGGTWAP